MIRLHRLDAWIAKQIMHPPIIWICQRVGINQYAFYRYAWWVAALQAIVLGKDDGIGWRAFAVIFAVLRTFSVGISPDRPARPSFGVRCVIGAFLVIDVLDLLIEQHRVGPTINSLLALTAEFAATIVTIPPRQVRERRRSSTRTEAHLYPRYASTLSGRDER